VNAARTQCHVRLTWSGRLDSNQRSPAPKIIGAKWISIRRYRPFYKGFRESGKGAATPPAPPTVQVVAVKVVAQALVHPRAPAASTIHRRRCLREDPSMPHRALTSAEISLPMHPDTARVTERIAQLARDVELVVLTDNHAGQPRMSPLAAVALAREQGVRTVVHISARDRNRLALQSEVIGAAALGCDGIVCLHGDDVPGIARVGDMTGTQLLAAAGEWLAPLPIVRGCVLNPFATDPDRELRLLRRKLECGATFAHTQMCFSIPALIGFLDRAGEAGLLKRLRVYVTVGVLRSRAMADRARSLPGCDLPDSAYAQVCAGGGRELALEMAQRLADLPVVDALHVMPLGDEPTAAQVAATFRRARQVAPRHGVAGP
jgi:methylenetetrahydrofolate reductase (NADPH)